ncbi:histidine--tRNA ligase, partial [Candidatus Shapirobacteria bacterium]
NYLQQVIDIAQQLGLNSSNYIFDPTMVRGLDYYTGPIFETYVKKPQIGSVTGGGRYNNLIADLGGPQISAVGTTLGLDRIVDTIIDQQLLTNKLEHGSIKVLIANFGLPSQPQCLNLATILRQKNINTLVYPYPDKLTKQIKLALSKSIPYLVILGPDEIKNNNYTLKNLNNRQQQSLDLDQLIYQLQSPKNS